MEVFLRKTHIFYCFKSERIQAYLECLSYKHFERDVFILCRESYSSGYTGEHKIEIYKLTLIKKILIVFL